MEFEQYLYDEFVAEANEHLATIEDDFLALEEQKDAPDPELVDKIFRAIHSVKGGSAFLDLNKINELSHAMENLLTLMREGETKPDPARIDALLKGVDLLSGMLADVKNSDAVNIEEIHARLTSLILGEDGAGTEAPEEKEPEEQDEPEKTATAGSESFPDTELDLEAVDFKSLLRRHDFIYLLKYDLSETSKAGGPDPSALVKELQSAGEIVDAKMTLASGEISSGLPEGPLLFEVLFATLIGEEYIEVVTGLPEDRIIPLEELKAEEPEKTHAPPEEEAPKETPEPAAQDEPAAPKPKDKPTPASGKSQAAGSSVRINVDILDKLMTLAGELVLVRNQQLLSMDRVDSSSRDIIQRLDVITTGLQEMIMRTRMQPVGNVFGKLPRIVRDLSNKLGKQITISITGNEVELDKTLLESMNDPLTHVVRNCCDHGIEPPEKRQELGKAPDGRITIRAYHEGGQINIEIKDDGAGIDPEMVKEKARSSGLKTDAELTQMNNKEIISMVMLPGFSTAKAISAVSGRGVGMDVVKHSIEDLGGSIDLDSWPGQGTSLHLRLPLTLAIIPCLIVLVGEHRFAIPQVNLEELVCLYDRDVYTKIEIAGSQEVYRLRKRLLPMVRLFEVLSRPEPFTKEIRIESAERHRRENERILEILDNHEAADPENPLKNGEDADADTWTDIPETLHFAVVKVGADRFGLIVDQVLGTEEIVVKAMHPSLKTQKCYSGATVMGDGGVALILDIEGVARHAGVFLEQQTEDLPGRTGTVSSAFDTQPILLFKSGQKERFALALPLIRRIEKISMDRIEQVGGKEFITVDETSALLLRLDKFLSVSPCAEKEEMFLILPKIHQPALRHPDVRNH